MPNSKKEVNSSPTCCCGLVQFNRVAIALAAFEFVFFALQLIVYVVDLCNNDDEFAPELACSDAAASAVPTILTIISLCLAMTAAVLLLFGVLFRAPYLLVPHLLMQVALMIASVVLIVHLCNWWLDGIQIVVSVTAIEHSENGYQGLLTAKNRPPIMAKFTIDALSTIVLLFTILNGLFYGIQIWLFHAIITVFRGLLEQPKKDIVPPKNTVSPSTLTQFKFKMSDCPGQAIPYFVPDVNFVYF
uniref:Lysosomal-associated transmembrane protein 4A n=1 Tax=Globodera pallida TaxID=36090 RepID=A0A183CCE3_GLOPA